MKKKVDQSSDNFIRDERPKILALLPVRDIVPMPGTLLPIFVGRSVNLEAMNFALDDRRLIALALHTSDTEEAPSKKTVAPIGTVAQITHSVRMTNGDLRIRLHVLSRIEISSFAAVTPFAKVRVKYLDEKSNLELNRKQEQLLEDVRDKFAVLAQYEEVLEDHLPAVQECFEPGVLADLVASTLPIDTADGQRVLEELNPFKRLELVGRLLNSQLDVAGIKERISHRVQEELGKSEHEQLLREQLKQIKAELGESPEDDDDLSGLKTQLEALKMPANAKAEAKKQLRRLQQLHPDTSEAALARTYLDWIVDLPWDRRTKDRLDLPGAKEILDEDHFGLDKTKERILDFLGVRKLKKEQRGPILLLVGPPGVGKTSLGRSIARALGRKFVRISVGGLRDEAELRGHRRTYVGAMPGRIIQALKTAGTMNPVLMLDEIDKVGNDYRGDPASVLLEILDPEQNVAFEDHYLNIPFDLSEVMFICTANITDTVPAPLLDRMEMIDIPGYTSEEKVEISKRYLTPRAKDENGLKRIDVSLSDETLMEIISGYTRESGVRELGRVISTVYRKVARTIAEGKPAPRLVTSELIEDYLGPVRYLQEGRLRTNEIGVATGLAWTPVGGEIMPLEVTITKGKGSLSLTGQMGDVMKESAMTALTWVQANAVSLGIDPDFYDNSNVHIHIPQGAIPKDGPSAGVALATALVSLLTKRPISKNVAMTGEITLRGNVLAVGGVREKSLAALRAGIKIVVIPKQNKRELVEFPKYLLEKMTFIPVESIEEVLKVAFVSEKRATSSPTKDIIRL